MGAIEYLDTNRPAWRTEPIADVVAWTRTAVTVKDVRVSQKRRIGWATQYGIWSAYDAAIAVPATRDLATGSLAIIQSASADLDVWDVQTQLLLAAQVAAGIITAEARAALEALGQRSATHWSLMGGDDALTDEQRADKLSAMRGAP